MKRFFALLLAAVMLLSACAPQDERPNYTAAEEKPQSESPAPQEEPAAQRAPGSVQTLAVPALPAIPEMPDWAEYETRIMALYEGDLSDAEYEAAVEQESEIWNEYSDAERAYHEALAQLRGDYDSRPEGFDGFTVPLAQQLLGGEENTVFSPANLYLALAMLAEVTDGESRAQILSLLGEEDTDKLRETAKRIWECLYLDAGESKTLLANSVWVDEGYEHHGETLDALAAYYYASAFSAPMGSAEADDALHAWLNENTGNLLEESVNGLETSELTRLILASALYFKGAWRDEFDASQTYPDTFTAADGSETTADFMHIVTEQQVIDREGYQVASLPFAEQGKMTFLLPDEGVSLTSLLEDGQALQAAMTFETADLPYSEVHWSVPKFDVDATLQLPETLAALGVTDVFDEGKADFSPFAEPTPEAPLYVSQIEHAARVLIDEEGCEAAAYTAIMVEAAACEPESMPVIEMDLDRPFLFVITGLEGLPLFIGTVNAL